MAVRRNQIKYWPINALLAVAPAFFAALFLVALARTVLAALGLDHINETKGDELPSGLEWVRFVGVVVAFIGMFATLAIRALRRGMVVSEAGCTMRYVFSTKRVPWSNVCRFFIEHHVNDEGADLYKCRLERCDGTTGSMPIGSWSRRGAEKASRWLNDQRRQLDRSQA